MMRPTPMQSTNTTHNKNLKNPRKWSLSAKAKPTEETGKTTWKQGLEVVTMVTKHNNVITNNDKFWKISNTNSISLLLIQNIKQLNLSSVNSIFREGHFLLRKCCRSWKICRKLALLPIFSIFGRLDVYIISQSPAKFYCDHLNIPHTTNFSSFMVDKNSNGVVSWESADRGCEEESHFELHFIWQKLKILKWTAMGFQVEKRVT